MVGVVGVVAAVLAGQQHVQHVVAVVVPLRIDIALQMRRVVVVFKHEVDMAAGLDGGADGGGHLVHPALVLDRVHGVEAQAVEAILHQPRQHVPGEERAHLRAAEIDRRAPGSIVIARVKNCGA